MRKVLFMFGGLPHYYNNVLNRLNKLPHTGIKVVIPRNGGATLGQGVHESKEDIEFNLIRLNEKKAWYGKPNFSGFTHMLKEEKPNVIVTIWPYALGFVLNPAWARCIRKNKIRLIYKDIPFNLPPYREAISFYKKNIASEDLSMKYKKWGLKQYIYYSILRRIIKWYLNRMDAHVYYSEEAFRIIGSYGIPREKIFITYNSPDTDRLFEIRKKLEGKKRFSESPSFRILHVGRLVAWKKVDILIKAFSELNKKYSGIQLEIIGSGPEEQNLKKLADYYHLKDSVIFTGALYDPEELGNKYLEASVYVLAGMGGLSINEAMCFGKPVICSRADGTEKALVMDGYNGFYFKENDPSNLALTIAMLIEDRDRLKKFGENSTSIIRDKINIHTVIDGYKKAFDYVMQD